MINKLFVAAGSVVLGVSAHCCSAQAAKPLRAKPPMAVAAPEASLKSVSNGHFRTIIAPEPISFRNHTAVVQTYNLLDSNHPVNIDWNSTALASRLSDIRKGTSLKTAVQRILVLGGREDGGCQTVPATRYYFQPGILVNIPKKDGRVTGPLHIALGQFSLD